MCDVTTDLATSLIHLMYTLMRCLKFGPSKPMSLRSLLQHNTVFMFFLVWFSWRQLAVGRSLKYDSWQIGWGECSWFRSSTAIHSVAVSRTSNLPGERQTLYRWAIAAHKFETKVFPKPQHVAHGGLFLTLRKSATNQKLTKYQIEFYQYVT